MPGTGERHRLTAAQLAVWRSFTETSEALRVELASRLTSRSGVSAGDYAVLLALSEADGHRLRSSALAVEVGWERSRLSHHLGRMEKRGLVHREGSAEDSRGAEAVMTDAGASAFRHASAPHLRDIEELFVSVLSEEQLVAVDEITRALRERLAEA